MRNGGRCEVLRYVNRVIICIALFAVPLGSCKKEHQAEAPPLAEVTTLTIEPKDTPITFEFVGQTESSRMVEIRSRVEGFLEKRVYEEGRLVKSGQTMFLMDRKPFEASLQEAKGELAQQQARLETAIADLGRVQPLAEKNAVSKKDLDDAIGDERSTRASVFAAQAKVRQAELNLGYTNIFSPVTGLSSRAKQQDGSYISNENSLLTYVAQLDPIWVNFSVSENENLWLRDQVKRNLLKFPHDENFEVEILFADGSTYPSKGHLNFADPSFSTETGTFLVRATFVNPDGDLRPGQFVKVRLNGAVRSNAVLVPQRAVMQGAKGHFVWVIDNENKAELRSVVVGDWHGDDWFISEGLAKGDQVVVDGAIKLSPEMAVKVAAANPAIQNEAKREDTKIQ